MTRKFRLFWGVAACINALVIGAAGGMTNARAADAAKGPTLDSIVQGAKREGKLSWSTNLEEHEVREMHKAFQKEFPFIKINAAPKGSFGPWLNRKLLSVAGS